MLTFIDISNWQTGIDLPSVLSKVDCIVVKATEGISYVDPTCDGFVQQAINKGKPWGFYHFARNNDAKTEADYFYRNCKNYFGCGIPVLDWEDGQSVSWVNTFVEHLHELSGIWCWVYSNPWRFNQKGVNSNCMRWVAYYPNVSHPTFEQAKAWTAPSADGLVGAWQFCSDGRIDGYSGNIDCDLFYGSKEAWLKYAGADTSGSSGDSGSASIETLENDNYKVTIKRK